MSDPRPGRLVALEGVDGGGKSTQARRLADRVGAILTFEPGATVLGSVLRQMVLGPDRPDPTVRTEALLMAADRAQHVEEVIRPALEAGRWVVTDRFSGSTLAYQGHGRGLPLAELRRLVEWAAAGVVPDVCVVVDIDPDVARDRMGAGSPDRLERLDPVFFARVRNGYLALASEDPTWVVVDGSGQPEEVEAAVVAAVTERLGPLPRLSSHAPGPAA